MRRSRRVLKLTYGHQVAYPQLGNLLSKTLARQIRSRYRLRIVPSSSKSRIDLRRNMRKPCQVLFVIATLFAASSAASAQMMKENPMVGGAAMYPTKTIVANAMNSADHTTLVAAVKAAGLVDTLNSAGPFTVFAPTNAAFDQLPSGTVEMLL